MLGPNHDLELRYEHVPVVPHEAVPEVSKR